MFGYPYVCQECLRDINIYIPALFIYLIRFRSLKESKQRKQDDTVSIELFLDIFMTNVDINVVQVME